MHINVPLCAVMQINGEEMKKNDDSKVLKKGGSNGKVEERICSKSIKVLKMLFDNFQNKLV